MNMCFSSFAGLAVLCGSLLLGGCATESSVAPPPAQTAGEVAPLFDVALVDVKPAPRYRVPPQYPAALRREGLSGRAVVQFVVDTAGQVQNVRVVSATRYAFGEAAAAAVSKWRFSPAEKDGQVVATEMQVPLEFSLNAF